MAVSLQISAESKVVKIYNLTRLKMEIFDINIDDLNEENDIDEFFDKVDEFIESGEADAISSPLEIRGIEPDEITDASLTHPNGEKSSFNIDDVELDNCSLEKYVKEIKDAKVGDIIFIRSEIGKAEWSFTASCEEETADPKNIKIGYYNCAVEMDTYQVLSESYYYYLCDTLNPDYLYYKDNKFETDEFDFDPFYIYGQLYVIKEDLQSGEKVIEYIPHEGKALLDDMDDL